MNLNETVRIGERIAANRFCIQPMEAGDAGAGGLPSKYTMARYHRYAAGGAGTVVIEAVTMQYRFLVGAKLSLFEEIEGGQELSEMLDLAAGLEARGTDFFIESLGNAQLSWSLMAPGARNREDLYKHLAAARLLKGSLKPETVVIGGGLSVLGRDLPAAAECAVGSGIFDVAAIGRQAFADPSLPEKYATGRLDEVDWCLCCDQCGRMLQRGWNSYCAVY